MTVKFTWTAKQWQDAILPAINAGVTAAAAVCADTAVQSFGPSPSPPGSPPGVDTGHLRRSIAFVSPEALGTPMRAAFGTAVEYGRHLEFGAFITPKRSKYLAVPVDRMLAAKFTRAAGGGSLRNVPGLKYIPPGKGRRNGGRLVLESSVRVNVRGAKSKTRGVKSGATVFVLKDSVVIQPRPWIMRAAWHAAPEAKAQFQATVKQRLVAAGLVKP